MSNFLTNNDLNLGALYIEKTTQVYQILSRKIGFRNPKANYLGVIAKNIESGVIKEFSSTVNLLLTSKIIKVSKQLLQITYAASLC